ncbi:MAG: response regulator transcription factor [Nitrospira sp.]|nr:response regulator transcription factor [Nitrospira sp.]
MDCAERIVKQERDSGARAERGVTGGEGQRSVLGSPVNRSADRLTLSRADSRPIVKPRGSAQPVRVLLVDDSVITLQGVKTFLSKRRAVEVIGAVQTRDEALAAITKCRPDVVVSEVRIGSASGIDMCRIIHNSHPTIAVLFFTDCDDTHLLHSAILAGARGYLLKTASGEDVAQGIESASSGRAVMDKHLTQQILAWIRDQGRHMMEEKYSRDELRLLSLVAAGKTNKEIARELNVQLRAVMTYLRKIYKRLRISRRSEAARCYVQREKDAQGGAGRER